MLANAVAPLGGRVKIGNCGSPPRRLRAGWSSRLASARCAAIASARCFSISTIRAKSSVRCGLPWWSRRMRAAKATFRMSVYSCGAMVHANRLILPYALSDTTSTIASVELSASLGELKSCNCPFAVACRRVNCEPFACEVARGERSPLPSSGRVSRRFKRTFAWKTDCWQNRWHLRGKPTFETCKLHVCRNLRSGS